jgi:hypothetical protein
MPILCVILAAVFLWYYRKVRQRFFVVGDTSSRVRCSLDSCVQVVDELGAFLECCRGMKCCTCIAPKLPVVAIPKMPEFRFTSPPRIIENPIRVHLAAPPPPAAIHTPPEVVQVLPIPLPPVVYNPVPRTSMYTDRHRLALNNLDVIKGILTGDAPVVVDGVSPIDYTALGTRVSYAGDGMLLAAASGPCVDLQVGAPISVSGGLQVGVGVSSPIGGVAGGVSFGASTSVGFGVSGSGSGGASVRLGASSGMGVSGGVSFGGSVGGGVSGSLGAGVRFG